MTSVVRVLLISVGVRISAAISCSAFDTCTDCTSHATWVPGSQCRWCPVAEAGSGHCHEALSVYNPCLPTDNIFSPDKCGASPLPQPEAPPKIPPFAKKVLAVLFKLFHISADPAQCVDDVGRTDVKLSEFAADVEAKRFQEGAEDLSQALSSLATAMVGCGANATALQAELRALATAARDAKLAGDTEKDLLSLAAAVKAADPTAVASSINSLLADWSTVSKACESHSKSCRFLTSLLKLIGVAAADVAPCEAALEPALKDFDVASASFQDKNYSAAVAQFARGLDVVAEAIKGDSCGLQSVAGAIAVVVPVLKAAVVRIEHSHKVHILVGSADIYDLIFHALDAFEHGNLEGFGVNVGLLLSRLRSSRCKTAACDVLEGLLASVQLAANDYGACTALLDPAFEGFEAGMKALTHKRWVAGANDLGKAVVELAKAVQPCGLTDFTRIAETLATQLNDTSASTEIGAVAQVILRGADVTLDFHQLVADSHAKDWNAVGHDLGTLSMWLNSTGCTSFVCKLVEGVLDGAAIPFQSLAACASDLRSAETDLSAGAAQFAEHQYRAALTYWAAGLNKVAKSVQSCHLTDELEYIAHESQVLGFAQIVPLDHFAQLLIHGADVYNELYHALRAMQSKDYRTAGSDLGKVMNQLSEWTRGHACTSPYCYVVLGMFEFLGDIQSDIRNCESDFKNSFTNFSKAYNLLRSENASAKQQIRHDFLFAVEPQTHFARIKEGVRDIGYGILDVAQGTKDCHLDDLSSILSKLALKLSIAPEVTWIEEMLHIIINGVHIESDIGTACIDYSEGNWVGFGFNIAKLIKTFAEEDLSADLTLVI
eukprot:TRINITY_DN4452_c0_g2_i1.p1 TRINITY_DN4452_c0_g2~~TRINITY_DN4452_c0_g2_i1.p1  ORF type:complete len:847 (+),score=163.63 TRINITY_DN4452_c0_g2_i1:49-2541(+)